MSRVNLFENAIAAVILATVVFLGWPAITQQNVLSEHCGCPAPNGPCVMPCSGCCDDPATPNVEPCPCENPTHAR